VAALENWNCNKRATCGANYRVDFCALHTAIHSRYDILIVDFGRNPQRAVEVR